MSEFVQAYLTLLIKQYYDKPKARAEITAMVSEWENVYTFVNQFGAEFDLDNATGDRLDKIGKIVGIPREIPNTLSKYRFAFEGDSTGAGFGTLFSDNFGAPFLTLFEEPLTAYQLDDFDYRFFIRAKVAVNQASAYMVSDEYVSLQDVIEFIFNGDGYVTDNLDMSLTLYVPYAITDDRFNLIRKLGLLPKPQAVRYSTFIRGEVDSFGFSNDVGASGFGSIFESTVGGSFATLYMTA